MNSTKQTNLSRSATHIKKPYRGPTKSGEAAVAWLRDHGEVVPNLEFARAIVVDGLILAELYGGPRLWEVFLVSPMLVPHDSFMVPPRSPVRRFLKRQVAQYRAKLAAERVAGL